MSGKALIIGVGDFDEDGQPVNWMFTRGDEDYTAVELGADGQLVRFGGYTLDELRAVLAESPPPTKERDA